MAVKSGRFGWIDTVPCVRAWNVDWVNEVIEYSSTCTGGTTASFPGINDWTGSYGAYGSYSPYYPTDANDILQFTGLTSETPFDDSGTERIDGWLGSCRMASIEFSFQFGENQLYAYVANIEGDGIPTYPEGRIPTSALLAPISSNPGLELHSSPEAANANSRIELLGMEGWGATPADPVAFNVEDVTQITFTIARPLTPYASTSTVNYQRRIPGNLSFTGSLTQFFEKFQDTDPANNTPDIAPRHVSMDPTQLYRMRIYVDATRFWDVGPLFFSETSRSVERETGDILTAEWAFNWAATWENPDSTPTANEPTLGWIRDPEGVFVFGAYPS